MTEYGGEKYVTATEVAKRFKISRGTCVNNVLSLLTACYLPGRKRALYKQSEVEQLSQVRTVERQVQLLALVKQDHEVVRIEENLCKEAL